jgi:glycosyltransferase involved in cell wall biosynthesis
MDTESIGFVIPVYNEEKILEEQLNELLDFLDSFEPSAEVVVVENGSQDRTAELLDELAAEESRINPLHLDRANYGLALKKGLEFISTENVFLLNIDFWDKDFIRNSLGELDNYDLIIGSKSHPESFDNRSIYRKFLTWGLNFLLGLMVGFKGTETHGLKALRKSAVERYLDDLQLARGMFDTELVIRAQYEGLSIKEVPVSLEDDRQPRNWMLQKIYQNVVDIVKLTWVIRSSYGFFNSTGEIESGE